MAEEKNPATPAGTPASQQEGIDVGAITKAAVEAATKAATAAVTEAVKPITDKVQTLEEGLANAATPDSVAKAVTDAIAQQSATQAKANQRIEFINANLKDVPDAYHSHIGDDPEKFEEQAQKLRATLKGDLEKMGVTATNVGSTGSDVTTKIEQTVDTSKLSGVELLQMGVAETGNALQAPGPNAGTAASAVKTADDQSTDATAAEGTK